MKKHSKKIAIAENTQKGTILFRIVFEELEKISGVPNYNAK